MNIKHVRSLIYKELLISKKYYISSFLIIFGFIIFSFLILLSFEIGNIRKFMSDCDEDTINNTINMVYNLLTYFGAFLACITIGDNGAFSADIKSNWRTLEFTLPATAEEHSMSKLIIKTANVFISFFVAFFNYFLQSAVIHKEMDFKVIKTFSFFICASLFIDIIDSAVFIKSKSEKEATKLSLICKFIIFTPIIILISSKLIKLFDDIEHIEDNLRNILEKMGGISGFGFIFIILMLATEFFLNSYLMKRRSK